MKKIFFMAAIAACMGVMTSCSQEDDIPASSTGIQNVIVFSTNSNVGITRSGQTINSLNKFTVSAVNADNTAHFSSVDFSYDYMEGAFKSSTPYYWPVGSPLSFYAISNPGSVSLDANSVPKYAYTNWGGETDLVAATVLAGNKQVPYPLAFQHVLSQIVVSADAADKTENLTYKLVDVEMTAPCDGTYSFANATGGSGSWEISNSATKAYSYASAFPKSFDQNGSATSGKVYWNILPVKSGTISFKVEYQVIQNGKIVADYTGSKAKTCELVNPNLNSGCIYTYNFNLTRGTNDEITFTYSMSGWDSGHSGTLTPASNSVVSYSFSLPSHVKDLSGKTITLAKAATEDEIVQFLKFGTENGYVGGIVRKNGRLEIAEGPDSFNTFSSTDGIHWTFGEWTSGGPVITSVSWE